MECSDDAYVRRTKPQVSSIVDLGSKLPNVKKRLTGFTLIRLALDSAKSQCFRQ